MKLISRAYADASYEVRIKSTINFYIQAVVAALLVILGGIQMAMGDIVLGAVLIVLALFSGTTVLVLSRGKYDLSSYLFSGMLILLVVLFVFSDGYQSPNTYAQFVGLILAVTLVASYQIRNRKHVTWFALFAFASYVVFVVWTIVSGAYRISDKPLMGQLDAETVALVLGLMIILFEKKTFANVTEDALEKFRESEEHSDRMISLVTSVSKQIDRTVELKESAQETGMAVLLIENRVKNILESVGNLDEGFASTKGALGTIGNSLEALKANAQNQSAHVTQSSAAIEQMVASIKSVSQTIRDRRASVDSLTDTSRSGEGIIKDTQSSFDEVIDQIDSIRDMTSLISGIAAQTNLLAMNAAIEAAHAGDAGRGFAVVADEIRKLAENSSSNAKKISENLKVMISSIESTGERVKRSGESFRDIRHEVDGVARVMDDIYNSTEELNAGSEEILRSTVSLSDLTNDVMDSVNEVDGDKRTIDANLGRNQELSEELGVVAGEIKKDADEIKLASDKVLNMAETLSSQSAALKKEI